MQQFNVQNDHFRPQGMEKVEVKAKAILAVQKKLAGLLGIEINDLFDRTERLELLDIIHHQQEGNKYPICVELLPKEKFISGWMEEDKLELLHAIKLNYDEWEVMINKMEIEEDRIILELI